MKKFFLVGTFLTLALAFTAVSGNAQTSYGSEVEIPFSFTVNNQPYQAGKYVVNLATTQTGSAALTITDRKSDSVQTILTRRGNLESDYSVKLIFTAVDGAKVLSQVVTPSGAFALPANRGDRNRVAQNLKTEFVGTTANLF